MDFPVDVPLGPWQVPAHPLFEALGYAVGFQLFLLLRRRLGEPLPTGRRPWLVLAAVAGALVGAKTLAWLVDPSSLWAERGDPAAWLRGKTIVGGLLGGWLAVELAKRPLGITAPTGDLYAVPLALGIAIGRLGCFLAGLEDRTHGIATTLPWGVDFGDGITRHPTQLYEVGFLIALALLLTAWFGRPHRQGDLFHAFVAGYLTWRFALGFIQPAPQFWGLATLQWASLLGLGALAVQRRSRLRSAAPPRPQEAWA